MKKLATILIAILGVILTLSIVPRSNAWTTTGAPYDTYTIGPKGDFVLTQTAYEPAGLLSMNVTLNQPRDIFIKDDVIYIADTGNKRILSVTLDGQTEVLITGLVEPTGVHVDDDHKLYVADKGANAIYVYDENLNLTLTIDRPDEPIFGINSPFVPIKVATGPRGIIYATGEGSVSGVMSFNYMGEFLGYLATNPTNKTFFREILEFFDQNLAPITPLSPENIAVDKKGSIYTTSHTETAPMKKFNIASQIVLAPYQFDFPVAVHINDFGNIYTITAEGVISEFDAAGNLLFIFGGKSSNTQVLGLFSNAQDIVVDSNYNIYGLDQGSNSIQILARSEFTALVHDGLQSLNNGIYDVEEWENILRMNSVFALANSIIARTYYRTGEYGKALDYYRIASDKSGYSDAFWQVRNQFLQAYLGIILSVGLALFVLHFVLKYVDQKYSIYDPIRKFDQNVNKVKILRELRFGMKVFRHPMDTFHEIKHEGKASNLSAIILYLTFIILNIIAVYTTGFMFNDNNLDNYNVLSSFLGLGLFLILFVFANYLISSLASGEGWFKDVFIGTAYSLMPYIIMTIPIILLSNSLTLNEIFIYQSVMFLRDAWTVILILLMVLEIHNYSVKGLIKNMLLTIFTMAIMVAILVLIYLLVVQMWDYITSVIKEVWDRVFN
ncbi:MAG TPA: YIP1 family protein [Acholeplasma sp.]|nr:YIP1 family protein [Acholeplasma sp.]